MSLTGFQLMPEPAAASDRPEELRVLLLVLSNLPFPAITLAAPRLLGGALKTHALHAVALSLRLLQLMLKVMAWQQPLGLQAGLDADGFL